MIDNEEVGQLMMRTTDDKVYGQDDRQMTMRMMDEQGQRTASNEDE